MRAARLAATPCMRWAPIASTRACSIASNTARASPPPGARASCRTASWQAMASAAASAWPRITAISAFEGMREGSGRRAVLPDSPGGSVENTTSTALSAAIARVVWLTARLNGSSGASFRRVIVISAQGHVGGRLRQVLAEAALVELGDQAALEFVAFVEEGQRKGRADIAEDLGVLRPGDDRARAHDGGQVAVHEGVPRQLGDAHHVR